MRCHLLRSTLALLLFSAVVVAQTPSAPLQASTEAGATTTIVLQYTSTNPPTCSDAFTDAVASLYAANVNIFHACVVNAQQYSFFPYSGRLPTDAQLAAMVSSLACLRSFRAVLVLSTQYDGECNFGGIDLKSALETLLMTSQDVMANAAPLTSNELVDFMTWRHARNIAQAANEAYDNSSESAVAYDRQLATASARLNVSLMPEKLHIRVNGLTVGTSAVLDDANGTSAGDAEFRSADTTSSRGDARVAAREKEKRVAPSVPTPPANVAAPSSAAARVCRATSCGLTVHELLAVLFVVVASATLT